MKAIGTGLVLTLFSIPTHAAGVAIAQALDGLAGQHRFTVVGAHRLGDAAGQLIDAGLDEQLRTLLAGWSYVYSEGDAGAPARLVVIGPKGAAPVIAVPATANDDGVGSGDHQVIALQPDGSHLTVPAALRGPAGREVTLPLIVATGASSVVLPKSLVERLGFSSEALAPIRIRTASGDAEGLHGRLSGFTFGKDSLDDVDVVFVDNPEMGSTGLLGMSVLGRYNFRIDTEQNQLVVQPLGDRRSDHNDGTQEVSQ